MVVPVHSLEITLTAADVRKDFMASIVRKVKEKFIVYSSFPCQEIMVALNTETFLRSL